MSKEYILLLLLLAPTAVQAEPSALKGTLSKMLCFIFSKEASDKTKEQVNQIMEELDPNQEVASVRTFNKLGEYFFGRCNSLSIPLLDTVVLSEGALEDLNDKEAERFMIGRSLCKMQRPSLLGYTAWPFIYAYLRSNYLSPRENDKLFVSETIWRRFFAGMGQAFVSSYLNRAREFNIDKEIAQKLRCADGTIKVLKYQQGFHTDESGIGNLLSYISPSDLGIFWLNNEQGEYEKAHELPLAIARTKNAIQEFVFEDYKDVIPRLERQKKSLEKELQSYHDNKPHYLEAMPKWLPYATAFYALWRQSPLTMGVHNDKLSSFVYSLPIVKYWSYFPKTNDRIAALEGMAERQKIAKQAKE